MSRSCHHNRCVTLVLPTVLTLLLTACGSGRETAPPPAPADVQKPAAAVSAAPAPAVAATAIDHAAVEAPAPEPQPSAPVLSVPALTAADMAAHQMEVDKLCAQIGDKLSSVDTKECLDQLFRFGGGYSVNGRPLMFKDMAPPARQPHEFRVLLMGGGTWR